MTPSTLRRLLQRLPPLALLVVPAPLWAGAVAAAGPGGAVSQQPHTDGPPVLVELFTSQGCSSCPPADALLRRLSGRPDVVPLAFHVDYWNHLGWTDPFSSEHWSRRQRAYADRFGEGSVYTPQLVVGGQIGEVGSDRRAVGAALDRAERPNAVHFRVAARGVQRRGGEVVEVDVAWSSPPPETEVLVALYERDLRTSIISGENRARTLEHDFVVRALRRAPGDGSPTSLALAVDPSWKTADLGVVVFAQDRSAGTILGLTRLEEPLDGW